MLSREEIIALLRKSYPYLAAEYGVKRIGLFCSYAEGRPSEESDIDLIVEFERSIGFRFIELAEYLEHLLGRKIDLLTPVGIRGIRIPRVAADIEGSIVYCSQPGDYRRGCEESIRRDTPKAQHCSLEEYGWSSGSA
jgi:predicted nucleotidyltransferase